MPIPVLNLTPPMQHAMMCLTSAAALTSGSPVTAKMVVPQFLVGTIKGDVYMLNNTFPKLEVSPWQLRVEGDVFLKGNNFSFLPRHGLDITVQHRINLVENEFHHLGPEALLYIKPEGKKSIFFMERNLIYNQAPKSLCLNEEFEPNSVVIKQVRFQQKCTCNITNLLAQALDIDKPTLQDIYNNEVHEQWFKNGECMLEPQGGISHISIDQFLIHSCLIHNQYTLEILLSIALIMAVIAILVILGWRRMKNTEPTSSTAEYQSYTEPLPPTTVPGSLLVVQPDTRTYQETEIHVLFDKAQEIKDNDGEEVYENEEAKDIKEKKRTPSPSIRQSCPVLPTHQNNQKHCVKFMQ
ncbi:uncharacterized protein LOC127007327 isoform X2 [Eriocheir sinensis]|uniref:uncharacterized protein LOC127007327 isoform X2 n=1 Tax=Eriocheir sinensis TaxID=95602 RepID=UPI0021C8D1C3|nr:uncharacterized protein LOC127007327 isoform X2 [Eriocheir sinensis]